MKAFKGLLYSDKRPSALLLKAITKPSVERKERIVTCYHSRGIAIRRLYVFYIRHKFTIWMFTLI